MGRRKERRLAAKSAAGRRVILDLFAEPSGDVCGSSPQEEVGGDGDSKSNAKLPSSPSSSGQQPENPLLLLEQYSDDELDEGLSEGDDACIDVDQEEKVASGKETEDGEFSHDKEPTRQCLMDDGSANEDPSQKLEKGSKIETGSDDLQKQTNKMEETKSPAAPDENPGDVSSSWKMVLHEESNQYYYWNIATGETSWEVPDILTQTNVPTSTKKAIEDTEGEMDAHVDTCKSIIHLDMEEGEMNSTQLNSDFMVNCQTSDGVDQGTKSDGSFEDQDKRVESQSNETSLPGKQTNSRTESTDLSPKLIKQCESLLKRLNSLKGLNCHLESQGLKMKCAVEIETRLSDLKALASHGLSLLPFWLHSEGQIKRLEAAVDGVVQCSNSSSLGEIETSLELREGVGDETEIGADEKKARFTVVEHLVEYPITKSNYEVDNGGVTTSEQLPSTWYSSNYPVNDVGGKMGTMGTEKESELAPRPALPPGEDVDMDVDMEVDDTSSVKSPHGEVTSVAPPSEEWIPPPPPDNEPFPPPPPDDEPFPPPPPDEPPESSYPLVSSLGSVQPLHYPEQYTLSYPTGSNLEYYGQSNLEVPGSVPYMHPNGGQFGVSHIPHYYEASANIYAVAPVLVNSVEPTSYYGLHNGTLNPVSLISGVAESSGTTSEPVPVTLDSGTVGSVDYYSEAGPNLLPETSLSVVKSGDAMVKTAPSSNLEARLCTGAQATSSVANLVSVSSTSDTTTAAATSKSQSKVTRSKKRTVAVVSTLRSNKKVSSLVDKWKAAKEELHEEEEEPEDSYEILERKRKREIEQWRAQQIASGEAKENANFQPLGGDWRERVKRKRAQQMKESKQSSPDVATDVNQQANLVKLSKGLPSGWQVYWDETSKQVYYGNVRTSETTWTRPTD